MAEASALCQREYLQGCKLKFVGPYRVDVLGVENLGQTLKAYEAKSRRQAESRPTRRERRKYFVAQYVDAAGSNVITVGHIYFDSYNRCHGLITGEIGPTDCVGRWTATWRASMWEQHPRRAALDLRCNDGDSFSGGVRLYNYTERMTLRSQKGSEVRIVFSRYAIISDVSSERFEDLWAESR